MAQLHKLFAGLVAGIALLVAAPGAAASSAIPAARPDRSLYT